jgi:hypothetical protein
MNQVPQWIPKSLRTWTQIIWFARFGALFACVLFAIDATRAHYIAAALQMFCLLLNVFNIVFCTQQRRKLLEYQDAIIRSCNPTATDQKRD